MADNKKIVDTWLGTRILEDPVRGGPPHAGRKPQDVFAMISNNPDANRGPNVVYLGDAFKALLDGKNPLILGTSTREGASADEPNEQLPLTEDVILEIEGLYDIAIPDKVIEAVVSLARGEKQTVPAKPDTKAHASTVKTDSPKRAGGKNNRPSVKRATLPKASTNVKLNLQQQEIMDRSLDEVPEDQRHELYHFYVLIKDFCKSYDIPFCDFINTIEHTDNKRVEIGGKLHIQKIELFPHHAAKLEVEMRKAIFDGATHYPLHRYLKQGFEVPARVQRLADNLRNKGFDIPENKADGTPDDKVAELRDRGSALVKSIIEKHKAAQKAARTARISIKASEIDASQEAMGR